MVPRPGAGTRGLGDGDPRRARRLTLALGARARHKAQPGSPCQEDATIARTPTRAATPADTPKRRVAAAQPAAAPARGRAAAVKTATQADAPAAAPRPKPRTAKAPPEAPAASPAKPKAAARKTAKPKASDAPAAPASRAAPTTAKPKAPAKPRAAKTSPRTAPGKAAAAAGPAAAPARTRRAKAPPPLLDRMVAAAVASLEDDKAEDVLVLDIASRSSFADRMIIASGLSERQLQAMARNLEEALEKAGWSRIRIEASPEWVLLDAGDLVVHLFRPATREAYGLERMWGPESPHG
jgi:ribosome-associated protein